MDLISLTSSLDLVSCFLIPVKRMGFPGDVDVFSSVLYSLCAGNHTVDPVMTSAISFVATSIETLAGVIGDPVLLSNDSCPSVQDSTGHQHNSLNIWHDSTA